MIALIKFNEAILMKKEEANELHLLSETSSFNKYGTKDGKIKKLGWGDKYYDECKYDEEADEYFYIKKEERKTVSNSYLYNKIQDFDSYVEVQQENQLVDLNSFALKCKYPYSIIKCVQSEEPTMNNISIILAEIEEKTKNLLQLSENMKSSFNEKVNVHMGGGLITTYNELLLKEDVCTDELQQELNKGWRILGVCVQPDQRRPDYILGRYNPNLDVTGCDSAKR